MRLSRPGTLTVPRALRSAAALCLGLAAASCGADSYPQTGSDGTALAGGDPELGLVRMREYGCGACHTIPGLVGTETVVGPPLDGIASRLYIAGVLPNSPENLIRWIESPPAIDSLSAMPDVGVTRADARHIAAYLYTLR